METKELALKTPEELAALERELRAKIRDLRFSLSAGQTKTVREIRVAKRDLARVLHAVRPTNQAAHKTV